MNTPWTIIAELESDNSRLFKESIIRREAAANNVEFFKGLKHALDKLVTFGVKQVPIKSCPSGEGLSEDNFYYTTQLLINRKLTGNAARDTIIKMMEVATTEQWNNWYRRILIKDLRCGVSEKTVNNVVDKINKDFHIPVFSCQLAHDSNNHESKVKGEKLVEIKLDGVRVLSILYPDGRVDQFSRNGKELLNFSLIKKQLSKEAAKFDEPIVLDGEIMSSSFQDLMTQVQRKDDVDADDAILYLFDMIPLLDFELGIDDMPQIERSKYLREWFTYSLSEMNNIEVVGQELVNLDTAEGKARFNELNKKAIEGGFEGIMIKDPNAPYEIKRSVAWLKLKPYIECSLTVIGIEEGTGKYEGSLGALICEGIEDEKLIRVNVGSGFTDLQRDEYYTSRDSLLNKIVEVRADAITQNQDGSYSLRFPRFKTFRGFENNEKL